MLKAKKLLSLLVAGALAASMLHCLRRQPGEWHGGQHGGQHRIR